MPETQVGPAIREQVMRRIRRIRLSIDLSVFVFCIALLLAAIPGVSDARSGTMTIVNTAITDIP